MNNDLWNTKCLIKL